MNIKSLVYTTILLLSACGKSSSDSTEQTTSTHETLADSGQSEVTIESTQTIAKSTEFNKELSLQNVQFAVKASNNGSINQLSITPSGLKISNDEINREIDGSVTGVEVADLNNDGSPEIYVFINSAGSGSYGSLVAYSVNNMKSMSEIYLPPIADDPINSKGYMGHDDFAILENTFAQRFPLYNEGDTNANPTGKTRQLNYKLKQGEASWILKLDKVEEF